MKVPVREFKAKLSRYLKDARRGRDIVVTSHGRSVARVIAVAETDGEEPSRDELLRRLINIPGVRLGTGGKPGGSRRPIRIGAGQKSLAEIVSENRR